MSRKEIKELLNAQSMSSTLDKMAESIVHWAKSSDSLLLMGMASRGIPLARTFAEKIKNNYGLSIPVGCIDASFYRDDYHYRKRLNNQKLQVSEMPANVDGRVVVLVDDVLYTGRSVRAALQAILDLGRPAAVKLCVLVDRGCRELPIAPDCIGISIETEAKQEVRVRIEPHDTETSVWLVEVEEDVT